MSRASAIWERFMPIPRGVQGEDGGRRMKKFRKLVLGFLAEAEFRALLIAPATGALERGGDAHLGWPENGQQWP